MGVVMKKAFLGVAAIAAMLGTPALAADMPLKAPPPPPAPVWSWTGCYIGINGGGLWAHKDWTSETAGTVGLPIGSHDLNSGLFGGQVGCDYQFSGRFVIGIQG